jgi:large subunit ribosomal protein L9
MDIILKQDIPGLGYVGDIVTVKPGYARNFLIPQKMAVLATESNKKIVAENKKQAAHKIKKQVEDAQNLAAELKKKEIKLPVKVGTTGKIFGSITTLQISRVLKDLGYEVDRKHIKFTDEINMIGKYTILVRLHKEVEEELEIDVLREEDIS